MAHIKKLESKNKGDRYRAQVFVRTRGDGTKQIKYKTFGTNREAKAWARTQETARGKGALVEGKVTIGALLDDLKDTYKREHRSPWAPLLIDVHLKPFFDGLRASQLTTTEINRYITQRQTMVKDSTIRGELAVLRRAFQLGLEHQPPKVESVPRFPRFKKPEPRTGFFEFEEYHALLAELPEELRPLLTYGYFTGSRKKEMLSLQWSEVDLKARVVRLPGTKTKNGKPRTIGLGPEVLAVLTMQRDIRDRFWPDAKFVFFRHATGQRIKSFHRAWVLASKRAGLWNAETGKPTRMVHDLRRTAVTNLVLSGVDEHTAMAISGHLTRSVFDNYDIVKERRLVDAAQRQSDYIRQQSNAKGLQDVEATEVPTSEKAANLLN